MNRKIRRHIEWKANEFSNATNNAVGSFIVVAFFLVVFIVISFFADVYSNIIASLIFGAIYAIGLILLICFARIFLIEQIRINRPTIITCPHSHRSAGNKDTDYAYLIVDEKINLRDIGLTIKFFDTTNCEVVREFIAKHQNSENASVKLQIEKATVHGDARYVSDYEPERPKIAPKNMSVYKFEITIFNMQRLLWSDNIRTLFFFSVNGSTYNNL